ncbi:DUF3137 domain-containing protein [Erythrobacter sp. YT30]|uniref:DUF3137 domain-containing protein n=1 Tax=Erythrobacter sp. YT30 TaxID=1735012 RepID=UPI0009EA1D36|nr:DUF3137 domain-containing protein [Erythrobacter sp. YT30]
MRADVQGLMGGELGQWLDEQSTMRKEAKEKAYWRWTVGACILLPLLAFMWFAPVGFGDFKVIISVVAVGGVSAWGYMPINEAKKAIKIGINSAIAKSLGVFYEHDLEPGREFEICKTYQLVPSYDRDDFEDRWHGQLEGHGFELYEAHLEERRGSGKNRRWVTVFRGAIIQMEFGRAFHSTTLLQRAGKHKSWFGLGGRKDQVRFKGHELSIVDQVHPSFEDVFDVYTDDQVEARVIVHPSFVEHLLTIEAAFEGDAVRAAFKEGKVIIAVESGNLFESGSLDSAGDHARAQEAAEQFASLAKLALAINQTERGQAMGKAGPSDPGDFGAQDGLDTARRVGGFGRKGV